MWGRNFRTAVKLSLVFSKIPRLPLQMTLRPDFLRYQFSAMKKKSSPVEINFEDEMAEFLEREGVDFDKKEFYTTASEIEESEKKNNASDTGKKQEKKKNRAKSEKSYPRFIKVENEEEAIRNLQNFNMKAGEFLDQDSLNKLIQMIEIYKSRAHHNAIKTHTTTYDGLFLISVRNFLEKYDALELFEYFIRCPVNEINRENFKNTVFKFQEHIELKQKMSQFNDFSSANYPESKYVLTDLILKHSNNSQDKKSEAESDDVIINKISKLNTNQGDNDQAHHFNLDERELLKDFDQQFSTEGFLIDDLNLSDFGLKFTSSDRLTEGKSKKVKESQKANGKINDLTSKNIEDESQDNQGKVILLEERFPSKTVNTDEQKGRTLSNKYQQMKLQDHDEVLMLQQKHFNQKELLKTNWIYLYDLPYEIENKPLWEAYVRSSIEKSIGKVKNVLFFNYKEFLDIKQNEQKVQVLESLQNYFEPGVAYNPRMGSSYEQAKSSDQGLRETLEKIENPKDKLAFVDKKLKKTEKLLGSLKKKRDKKLNKSYALIELQNEKDKLKALQTDFRVFGIKVEEHTCRIDDADFKLTLVCNNVRWGASLSKFHKFLNDLFESNNISDLKVDLTKSDDDKLITKYFVLLRFNSLSTTVKAINILRNSNFENRELKINHLYGPLKVFKGKYREILDYEHGENIMKRVQENKLFELSKIINRCTEDYESTYEDPAVLISEDDPLFNEDDQVQAGLQNLSKALTTETTNNFEIPAFQQSIIISQRFPDDLEDFLDREPLRGDYLGGRK